MRFFDEKKGITLVETLVAISIIILINGILSVFIVRSFDVNRYTIEQGLNTAIVQNTLYTLSRYIREARQSDEGGYLIKSANEFEITFFSNVDTDADIERVHVYLEGTDLKVGLSETSGFPPEYPGSDEEIKTMASNIANTASEPIFAYYNKDYPSDVVNNPLEIPPSPSDISLIRINIYANIDPEHVPNRTQIETFVRPRNIDYD